MLIRPLDDIHLEWSDYRFELPELPTDSETTLVLAGDIGVGVSAVPWIEEVAKRFRHVIYVAGNHEFYHQTFQELLHDLKERFKYSTNVFFLEKESVVLEGIRFFGGTFWTDMKGGDKDFCYMIRHYMNDFRCIKRWDKRGPVTGTPVKNRFDSRSAYFEWLDTIIALNKMLEEPFDGPTVVVSHHAPSEQSSEPRYTGEFTQPAYFFDAERYVNGLEKVDLWFHGHMHTSTDYNMKSGTRVICNARGYKGEEFVEGFNPIKVVEINGTNKCV